MMKGICVLALFLGFIGVQIEALLEEPKPLMALWSVYDLDERRCLYAGLVAGEGTYADIRQRILTSQAEGGEFEKIGELRLAPFIVHFSPLRFACVWRAEEDAEIMGAVDNLYFLVENATTDEVSSNATGTGATTRNTSAVYSALRRTQICSDFIARLVLIREAEENDPSTYVSYLVENSTGGVVAYGSFEEMYNASRTYESYRTRVSAAHNISLSRRLAAHETEPEVRCVRDLTRSVPKPVGLSRWPRNQLQFFVEGVRECPLESNCAFACDAPTGVYEFDARRTNA